MAVSFGAIGTAASGTTSCAPSYPTGISASTSVLYCVVTGRSNTASTVPTMPAGWTWIGGLEGGTGTWGVDTGTRRVDVFRKDTVAGTETGSVTVSLAGTTANTLRATIMRLEKAANATAVDQLTTGQDTTHDTSWSVTGSNVTWSADGLLLVATAQSTDTATQSAQAVTASGVTFGTLTNRASVAVTNGNDHRHVIDTRPLTSVTGGKGAAAPTWTHTNSANASGVTAFLFVTETLDGSLSVSETGADTLSAGGDVIVAGALAASETGADVFAATGSTVSALTGSMAATEEGADVFAATGDVVVQGALAATETGADVFAATGDVVVQGSLAASETGADVFEATGDVIVTGALAASETGADIFTADGTAIGAVSGNLTATEDGADTLAATGDVIVQGAAAATEGAADTFAAAGAIVVQGVITLVEPGADTFSATGQVLIQGDLAAVEAADSFAGGGVVLVRGAFGATEEGADVFAASGATTAYGGVLMRWNGSAWVPATLQRFNGATWVPAALRVRVGADWLDVNTTGV